MRAGARKSPSERRPVAAVVTFSTKNQGFFAGEIAIEARTNGLHTGRTGSFHQEQGRRVKVLNGKPVDLANLLGGEYGLHEGMISEPEAQSSSSKV